MRGFVKSFSAVALFSIVTKPGTVIYNQILDEVMEENRRKIQKQIHVNESAPVPSLDYRNAVSSFESLPGEVIHHIFSFLPGKDAAIAAVLSKTCQKQCAVLNFDEFFYSYGKEMELVEEDKCTLFIKMVYDSLGTSTGTSTRFCPRDNNRKALRFHVKNELILGHMNQWLELVRINKFTELFLDLQQFYRLPQTIFALKSLTALHLKGCELPFMRLNESSILDSLRELHLTNVSWVGTLNDQLRYICPSIVSLSLIWCSSFNWHSRIPKLILSGLHKLTEVNVKDHNNIRGVVIDAQSLRIFKHNSHDNRHMFCDIDVNSCRNLEVLHLNAWPGIAGVSPDICAKFPFLKTLSLGSCGSSTRFKISSPVLQILELRNIDFLLDSAIDTPNLQSFKYMNYYRVRSIDQRAFPAMTSKPQEIKIKLCYSGPCICTSWFSQLRTFIRNLPSKCVKLSIKLDSSKVKFKHEELEDVGVHSLPPPPVKLLKLKISSKQETCSELLNGFFWSCHPDTLSISSNNKNLKREFKEALCKEFSNKGTNQNCCRSNHIRCWRHYLKDDFEVAQLFGAKCLKTNFYMKW